MKAKRSAVVATCAVLVVAAMWCSPAMAQSGSLADQLKTQLKLTKLGMDSGGLAVVDAGAVLVVQKGGILGVPPANAVMAPAVYKEGELHSPSAGQKMFLGPNTRLLPVGEKVYVTKIDANAKSDKVTLTIIECDSCNGVQQPSFYKSQVAFQFPKGYLQSADAGQVEDVISQVLTVDGGGGAQQQSQDSSNAQSQQAPAQAPAEPAQIQLGQTTDQVQAALGKPDTVLTKGSTQIYVYKQMKITFVNGKVSDFQ